MIEIFPISWLSIVMIAIVKYYLILHNINKQIKLIFYYRPYKSHSPTVYFIIKSRFLKSEKMYSYLRDIRSRSDLATIIIIGSHINYDELFKNHYRVFGVIDTTEDKSLAFIRDQVHFYLDALYGSNQNQAS